MDLNNVFLLVLAIVVAIGIGWMSYNYVTGKKQTLRGADEA